MCLRALPKDQEKIELEELPAFFPCWKIIRKSGHCEYDVKGIQPKIVRGTQVAKRHLAFRALLRYPYGFHAYLEKPCPKNIDISVFKIIKCWARKEDITCIGYAGSILAVAVSKITRK